MRQRINFYEAFQFHEVEQNTILLQAKMLPDKIYFVLEGTVTQLSTIDEKQQHPGF